MNTELISADATTLQIVIWIGSAIVSGLVVAIVVLWKAKESRDNYIREQDKANLQLLNEIANNYKSLGVDVSKIEASTSATKPLVNVIRDDVKQLLERKTHQ